MIVIKDIKCLQHMSFEDSISYFLPTAKIIRIAYSLNWLTMKQKVRPSHLTIYWVRIEHPDILDIFRECIMNALLPDMPDELLFVDLSTREGIKIVEEYT